MPNFKNYIYFLTSNSQATFTKYGGKELKSQNYEVL